jgi:CheY-like chemotaxis protein
MPLAKSVAWFRSRRMKILLAEDDLELAEVLRDALAVQGHEVWVARDGKEACNRIPTVKPQALITDILMPERDGLELIREFRRLFPQGLVIAMSGGSGHLSGQMCLELAQKLGADVVVNKPFQVSEFVRVVEDLIQRLSAGS